VLKYELTAYRLLKVFEMTPILAEEQNMLATDPIVPIVADPTVMIPIVLITPIDPTVLAVKIPAWSEETLEIVFTDKFPIVAVPMLPILSQIIIPALRELM
jgi:hypothetical protein